jgi:hypothetical protein
MAKYHWRPEVKVIAVPTAQARFGPVFLKDTGFKASLSNDLDVLRQTFSFVSGPYAVALQNGRQKASMLNFEGDEPAKTLRELQFID